MAYLTVEDGRRVYYEYVAGHASKTPIVLVHGWGVDLRCWDGIAPLLWDSGRAVLRIDHRCCGGSDRDFGAVAVADIARDIVGIVEQLELPAVVLNGWSLGGAVVVDAAVRLGERVRGLVLTGAATPRYTRAPDFEHGGTHADVEATLAAITADRAATFEGVARAVYARDPGTAALAWMAGLFLHSGARAYATLRDLADVDQRGLLPRIGAPTLLAHGDADQFVGLEIARAAAALLPDASLSIYPDCGHAPFLEARERYLDELQTFLARIDA